MLYEALSRRRPSTSPREGNGTERERERERERGRGREREGMRERETLPHTLSHHQTTSNSSPHYQYYYTTTTTPTTFRSLHFLPRPPLLRFPFHLPPLSSSSTNQPTNHRRAPRTWPPSRTRKRSRFPSSRWYVPQIYIHTQIYTQRSTPRDLHPEIYIHAHTPVVATNTPPAPPSCPSTLYTFYSVLRFAARGTDREATARGA